MAYFVEAVAMSKHPWRIYLRVNHGATQAEIKYPYITWPRKRLVYKTKPVMVAASGGWDHEKRAIALALQEIPASAEYEVFGKTDK